MFQMIWQGPLPPDYDATDAVPLTTRHAAQAVELAALTMPGPFGPRTIKLRECFGYFEDDHLIAMAGERTDVGSLREVSGVCTHPDFQGRGLARRLMHKLVRRQMLQSVTPFLHVMRDNLNAHMLYERMGFRDRKELAIRVISPC